jgi:hypothetical protein
MITQRELSELSDLIDSGSWRSMLLRSPELTWNVLPTSLMHYNRVEGFTVGTRARVELEPLSLTGSLWMGTAEPIPGFAVDLARTRLSGSDRVGIYRRVDAFAPEDRPFSKGSSISAFAFGRDDGDYYQTLGAALSTDMSLRWNVQLGTRLYVEQQRPMAKQTDASIPGWTADRLFRPNPPADPADQIGLDVRVGARRGLNPDGFRGTIEAGLMAEQGTFSFGRPSVAIFTTMPLPGRFTGALEGGVGTSFGDLPMQREWYVGGTSSVRGFRAEDRLSGSAFWRARAEVGNQRPAFRLILFTDAGWAGPRSNFAESPALVSGGVGASILDGLVRADLARTLRGGPRRWGISLSLDAPL